MLDDLQAIVDRGPGGETVEYARAPGGVPSEAGLLPSDASVIAEVEAGGASLPRWMRGALRLSRGGALGLLFGHSATGSYEEFILDGYAALLTRQAETGSGYRVEFDGTVIGGAEPIYSGDQRLSNVFAIAVPGGADGVVDGANAIVVRTIPGTDIRRGFAVSINSTREAEIYNDGIAANWSSDRINAAIQAERRSGRTDPSFTIGDMRYANGVAFIGGSHLADADHNWLSDGTGGIPGQVAARLNGQRFNTFDAFRRAFWKTVADIPLLADTFSRGNVGRMRDGLSPIATRDGWHGRQRSMVIHHQREIQYGGGVYDMSNMRIVTPRIHHRMHYGR